MPDRDDLRTVAPLGLALGGGGALGAAHVGVLQVLVERGIQPSIVVGTSIGSVIGAAYAMGVDPYRLERMVTRAKWGTFAKRGTGVGFGALDTEGLRRTVESMSGDLLIEDLPCRYGAVATDVLTRKAVTLESGSLCDAMCASIAVPVLFRPARHEGRVLVDGGLVQNLPLEAAFQMGAEHVIGVRLAPEWDSLPQLSSSVRVHQFEIRGDVTLIHPRLGSHSQWNNKGLGELVAFGRGAAETALADYPVVRERPPAPPLTSRTSASPEQGGKPSARP